MWASMEAASPVVGGGGGGGIQASKDASFRRASLRPSTHLDGADSLQDRQSRAPLFASGQDTIFADESPLSITGAAVDVFSSWARA